MTYHRGVEIGKSTRLNLKVKKSSYCIGVVALNEVWSGSKCANWHTLPRYASIGGSLIGA